MIYLHPPVPTLSRNWRNQRSRPRCRRGYTINVPLASGAGDEEYLTVFHTLVAPVLEAYNPQLILVSAGFDAHERDPLGGMALTDSGYAQMLKF